MNIKPQNISVQFCVRLLWRISLCASLILCTFVLFLLFPLLALEFGMVDLFCMET